MDKEHEEWKHDREDQAHHRKVLHPDRKKKHPAASTAPKRAGDSVAHPQAESTDWLQEDI